MTVCDEIAAEAGLSESARERLAKARRVLDAMIATIAFFWTTVAQRLASRDLPPEVSTWLREQLIAGFYLKMAAAKARTAAQRERLRARAEEVLARARSPDGVWGRLSVAEQGDLEGLAQECAGLFQRSSSCVEGRNGQLSLKHHALHRLTPRKLAALGVLHNFLVQRARRDNGGGTIFWPASGAAVRSGWSVVCRFQAAPGRRNTAADLCKKRMPPTRNSPLPSPSNVRADPHHPRRPLATVTLPARFAILRCRAECVGFWVTCESLSRSLQASSLWQRQAHRATAQQDCRPRQDRKIAQEFLAVRPETADRLHVECLSACA